MYLPNVEKGIQAGSCLVKLTPVGNCDPLFTGIKSEFAVLAFHNDTVEEIPAGCKCNRQPWQTGKMPEGTAWRM